MILAWLMCPMWAATGPTPRHCSIPSEKELARVHAPLWLIYRFFFFLRIRSALNKYITPLLIKHLKASSSKITKGILLEKGKRKYTCLFETGLM